MEYERRYQGYLITVVTAPERTGSWTFSIELPDLGARIFSGDLPGGAYPAEERAREAAFAAAAAEIDRIRTSRGKP